MAKFFGTIGYAESKETGPGIWEEVITERVYYGDVLQFHRRTESSEYLNDNITVNNKISVIADAFAYRQFGFMRYVEWMGVKWKITNVEVQYPRLILTIGGVYHAESNRPTP